MKRVMKIIFVVVTLGVMGWAFFEQTKEQPNVWIQIVAVILFFAAMSRLTRRTASNSTIESPAEREFNTGIKKDLIELDKEDQKDAK
ncbi:MULTISPECIES: hypothetical protein [Myroides]|uniref:Uncharacterized protein n=1 Tax=Myroides albus TaxID=2562892 RepID=A0A6I3LJV7_9FLAO|nr:MULTISPECIES: hypothetical protein [Myroides]MTG97856.1 hypothetical protein [Myroides albus]MVX35978.1 hypothetical protein [Myroides sp. LoEW2-1]UVD79813.1 hypothetical protein NWE55_00525 [Myroides albus]